MKNVSHVFGLSKFFAFLLSLKVYLQIVSFLSNVNEFNINTIMSDCGYMANKESNDILLGNPYTSMEICRRIVTLPKSVDTHYTIRLILDLTGVIKAIRRRNSFSSIEICCRIVTLLRKVDILYTIGLILEIIDE